MFNTHRRHCLEKYVVSLSMIFHLVHEAGHGHVLPQVLLHHLAGGLVTRVMAALTMLSPQQPRALVQQPGQPLTHVTEQRIEWEHSKGGREQARALSRFARAAIVDVCETIEVSGAV